MYEAGKRALLALMRVPPEPHDPMGDVASLRVFRAAQKFLYYRYCDWAIKEAIFLIVILVIVGGLLGNLSSERGSDRQILEILSVAFGLVFVLQLVVSFFVVRLDYEMRWYKISDRSLRIRIGIWGVREHTVTFANIQNISVKQGPLERLFGIANLHVETAGGGMRLSQQQRGHAHFFNMHEAVFRGVDNAEEIRDIMIERLRRLRDGGLGNLDESASVSAGLALAVSPGFAGVGSEAVVTLLAALKEEAAAFRRVSESFAQN